MHRLFLTTLLALASPVAPVGAQTFFVDTFADSLDANPGDGLCADANGNCSLRAAIMEANAMAAAGGPSLTVTIQFALVCPLPPCVLTLQIPNSGPDDEDGALEGDLDILGPLVHGGAGLHVILDGGADGIVIDALGIDRLLHVIDADLTLRNVQLRGGSATLPSAIGLPADGGGILVEGSPSRRVALENSRITLCSADHHGGAIAMRDGLLFIAGSQFGVLPVLPSGGNVAALNGGGLWISADASVECHLSEFTANEAGSGTGGGVCLEPSPAASAQVQRFVASQFIANRALMLQGGGLFAGSQRTTEVEGCTFLENQAGRGGGMAVQVAEATIRHSQFLGNTAVGESTLGWAGGWPAPFHAAGGGLVGLLALQVTIEDSSFQFNAATSGHVFDMGGGIASSGSMEIDRTVIEGNVAGVLAGEGDGGGLAHALGTTILRECRIVANQATRGGGGILALAAGGGGAGLIVQRSEIADNEAELFGGGILNGTFARFENSTISGNRAGSATGTYGQGAGVWNGQFFHAITSVPSLTLLQTTVATNEVVSEFPAGGGLWSHTASSSIDRISMRSVLLANNVRFDPSTGVTLLENAAFAPGANTIDDLGWNLDSDGTAALTDPTSQSGSIAAPLNAGISGLLFNGGLTRTHALFAGSPAIDTGSCDGWGGVLVTIDQRGEPRVAPCDVGAFEASPGTPGGSWQVTVLHPAGAAFSRGHAIHGIVQGGQVAPSGAPRAARWQGTPGSWGNLEPAGMDLSVVSGVHSDHQVGTVYPAAPLGGNRAALWSGSSNSYFDLHTLVSGTVSTSYAQAVWVGNGGQPIRIAGYGLFGTAYRALTWQRVGAFWQAQLLHPPGAQLSRAFGAWMNMQVGHVQTSAGSLASLWFGTSGTWLNLNPALPPELGGAGTYAQAEAVWSDGANGMIGGWARNLLISPTRYEAVLWTGSGTTWSGASLHPSGADESHVYGVYDGKLVGSARVAGVRRASFWSGTAASWEDLHADLPPQYQGPGADSIAYGVWDDGQAVFVIGEARNTATSSLEAVMWVRPGSPYVMTLFCPGDGSFGVNCPQGNNNDGSKGIAGCATSADPGGAALRYTVSGNLVLLSATGVPAQPRLWIQANNAVNGGNGSPFLDGLRCVGGNVVRLEVQNAAAPPIMTSPLPPGAPGQTLRYQLWFRDPGIGTSANLSNALQIVW